MYKIQVSFPPVLNKIVIVFSEGRLTKTITALTSSSHQWVEPIATPVLEEIKLGKASTSTLDPLSALPLGPSSMRHSTPWVCFGIMHCTLKRTFKEPFTSNQGLIVTSMSPYSWTMSSLAVKRTSGKKDQRPSTPGTPRLTTRASCFIPPMPLGKRTVQEEGR